MSRFVAQTMIEIGAGGRTAPGYLAVDLNPRRADVVADGARLPFRDGCVTAMRAVDVLEHISYRDTARVLDEWARVCCDGAELYVQVPDADAIMKRYCKSAIGDQRRQAERARAHLPIPADQHLPATALAGAQWRLLGGHDDGERVDTAAGDDWRWNAHFALFSRESLTAALEHAGFTVTACPTNPFPNLCCTARRHR